MIIKITCCHRDASSNVMRVQGGFRVKLHLGKGTRPFLYLTGP